jgi:hypothetical protein
VQHEHETRQKAMKVWTIQPSSFWERLQSDGILHGPTIEETFVADDPLGRIAYRWLAEQMEQRLGPRPHPGSFPLWAWYQWRDAAHPRPDLRASAHLPAGMKGVRIELEIEERCILLSDFQQWHLPLNYAYLSLTEAEDSAFEAELLRRGIHSEPRKPLSDPHVHASILNSWERIFEIDRVGDPDWWPGKTRAEKSIQGTFWQVSLSQVRQVNVFTARTPGPGW